MKKVIMMGIVFIIIALWGVGAVAEELTAPKITSLPYSDPGVIKYKYANGDVDNYTMSMKMDSKTNVQEGSQSLDISIYMDLRLGMGTKCTSDANSYKLEAIFSDLKMKQNMNFGGILVDLVVDNDRLKAYKDGTLIADTTAGIGEALAKDFFKEVNFFNKKGTFTMDANGMLIGKIEGDPEFVKFFEKNQEPGIFPLVFKNLASPKQNDSWGVDTEIKEIESISFEKPIKSTSTFKVEGLANVGDTQCLNISFNAPLDLKDMNITMKNEASPIKMKMSTMNRTMSGRLYFNTKDGRFTYGDIDGSVTLKCTTKDPDTKKDMAVKCDIKLDIIFLRDVPKTDHAPAASAGGN